MSGDQRPWVKRVAKGAELRELPELNQLLEEIASSTGFSRMTVQVCIQRGLESADAIRDFLAPKLEGLKDPYTIRDMKPAIDRLVRAREAGEKLRIFGDYDVDGTTGAALLSWVFRDFGFQADARQPDRFKDGYGLNVGAVESAVQEGARVLITVDCGITSFDAAKRAQELGIDLIIVDHHQIDPNKGLPPALAVIDPQRVDCESGLKQLCGCGLAFYLARALRTRGRDEKWWPEGKEPNLKQHLDLVVMATAADMVPLTGDNHILARHGMDVLKASRKPGVRALLEVAGIGNRALSPGHLGFVLGPRINASGRMGSASLALEILTTTDSGQAMRLASQLEEINKERADTQNRIWDEVKSRVEAGIAEGRYRHGIVVADAGWHEGVVGIVASRVVETFQRPAAVIALREDFGKGSVRTFAGKDVLAALRTCSQHLLGFGGHRHAAGLSVPLDGIDALAKAFDEALSTVEGDPALAPLYIEGNCSIDDLDIKTLQELENLGPFGPGNPEPLFCIRAKMQDHKILKGRHLKMNLASALRMRTIEAIWFNASEEEASASKEGEFEWAGVPELNRFQGRITPTLRIRDRRPISG